MKTVPIHHNTPTPPARGSTPEVACLCAEIAARLVEWGGLENEHRVGMFITKLSTLRRDYEPALWIVLRLMSGDVSEVTRSYSAIGRDKMRSKQAVQQEFERSILAIEIHFPELADAIIDLRRISARLDGEQRQSGKESL